MALKFVPVVCSGVPDRIVLLPNSKVYFVELKRDDGQIRPIQQNMFDKFKQLGFPVHIIANEKMIDDFIAEVTT